MKYIYSKNKYYHYEQNYKCYRYVYFIFKKF